MDESKKSGIAAYFYLFAFLLTLLQVGVYLICAIAGLVIVWRILKWVWIFIFG